MLRNITVIPAYNEADRIEEVVTNLALQRPAGIVVVDNNSTDSTARIVKGLQSLHDNIHLIHEAQQGISWASGAGFRYAIDVLNADLVSRTDADTIPHPTWTNAIQRYFGSRPDKQLVGGPETALKDRYYQHTDALWPATRWAARLGAAALYKSMLPIQLATGHNMAIRSRAYDYIGGFSPVERDDDIILTRKVALEYGNRAIGFCAGMRVATSMRRLRQLGYMGTLKHYNTGAWRISLEGQTNSESSGEDLL